MLRFNLYITAFLLFVPVYITAQGNPKYITAKAGKWTLYNNMKMKTNAYADFARNVQSVAEWMHQRIPLMKEPRGFDLETTIFSIWDEDYKLRVANYAMRCELAFDFQLFLLENGKETKWMVEPPRWSFYMNNTASGHGSNWCNYEGYKVQVDDPSLEKPLGKAIAGLCDIFPVFPLEKEIAPGVQLFGDGNLVVFNPDRPPFWVPVTVKEALELRLAYYSIRPTDKQQVYPYLKKAYDEMSVEELNAPAYLSNHDAVVVVSAKTTGLQLMRFNKDYWNRSLPPSAIQFITMYYAPYNEKAEQEFIKNNGRPNYPQKVRDALPLAELASLIMKK